MLKKLVSFFNLYTEEEYKAAIRVNANLRSSIDDLKYENERLQRERNELEIKQAEKLNTKDALIYKLREENKRLKKELKGCVKLRGRKR